MTEDTRWSSDALSGPRATVPDRGSAPALGYIGLGSNLGNREAFMLKACELLRSTPWVAVRRLSSAYESEPWGYVDQAPFLNAVVEIVTELRPIQLFCALKTIETKLGRKTRFRWGPREIDLDLLLYGDQTVSRRGLVVPHPAMYQRAFVLAPLAELAPWLEAPGGEPIRVALERLDPAGRQTTIQALSLAPAVVDPLFDNKHGVD